jgi:uncharacterized protein YcfJ
MRTRTRKTLCIMASAAVLLAGCASAPTGENYIPLVDVKAGEGQRFQQDLDDCQAYATQRGDAASGAVAGAVAGALFGAVLGAIVGVSRNEMAGVGALTGGLQGAVHNEGGQRNIIRRCLTGRGYTVLD